MRAVIQRVSEASVAVDGKTVGEIKKGFLVLLGVTHDDEEADADYLASKITGLRVFEDEEGKMNLSLADVQGEILAISQFTLHADTRKGRRPSFIKAAHPDKAEPLYDYFIRKCRELGIPTKKGIFGAMMKIHLVNEGPVTIIIDSSDRFLPR
ncbi:MAG: D-aminoacyl-tRNA deacylase [Calditrichia bacterium]